jgi:tRNA(Ile)-lysidine synthase
MFNLPKLHALVVNCFGTCKARKTCYREVKIYAAYIEMKNAKMKNNDLLIPFHAQLNDLATEGACFTIALSGGLDSVVLLHLFSRLKVREVTAHHIHHGLSENADNWVNFCKQQCEHLNIPLTINHVVLDKKNRTSLEALAREARYLALQNGFNGDNYLVTAHHQDDQLETILLALKRGAGLTGLQGIVAKQELRRGYLIRPLLDFSREQLERYAQYFKLAWIEDESNADQNFDRNFIRHSITPLLKKRWPAIAKTTSRSATHCQAQQVIIDELAKTDFNGCVSKKIILDIAILKQLSKARRDNVLRYWFKKSGLNYPSTQQLATIWDNVALAQADASPRIALQERSIHRYRGQLYLIDEKKFNTNNQKFIWQGEEQLEMCSSQLILKFNVSKSFLEVRPKHIVEIFFREHLSESFKCQPIGRDKSRSVKKLLHEYHVPPWQRNSVPFIFVDSVLVEAAGVWRCDTVFSESLRTSII